MNFENDLIPWIGREIHQPLDLREDRAFYPVADQLHGDDSPLTADGLSPVPTGFKKMDWPGFLNGGLRPGLHVIGGRSSIGKTSFILQMADSIARTGRRVLFATFGNSDTDLICKSVSRRTRAITKDEGRPEAESFSAQEVLDDLQDTEGETACETLKRAWEQYEKDAENLFIYDGFDGFAVSDLAETVGRVETWYRPPVLFVDSLQELDPPEDGLSGRQELLRNLNGLKQIARHFKIPVVLTTRARLANSRESLTEAECAEMAVIESVADSLMVMSLEAMERPTRGHVEVLAELAKNKRVLNLHMIKNRYGVPGGMLQMVFEPLYSRFEEV